MLTRRPIKFTTCSATICSSHKHNAVHELQGNQVKCKITLCSSKDTWTHGEDPTALSGVVIDGILITTCTDPSGAPVDSIDRLAVKCTWALITGVENFCYLGDW